MKFAVISILILSIILNQSMATCVPKTDIYEDTKTGRFSYSEECHIEFGKLRQTEKERQDQITHLEESIKLKDLALDISSKRIENWQDATYKVEDRILKMEKTSETIKMLYFGMGIVVMGAAVWGAGQLKK
jgi:hypothetical protein